MKLRRTLTVAGLAAVLVAGSGTAAEAGEDLAVASTTFEGGMVGWMKFDSGGPNEWFRICDLQADGLTIRGQIKWGNRTPITLGDPTHGEDGCGTIDLRIPEGTKVRARIGKWPGEGWGPWHTGRA